MSTVLGVILMAVLMAVLVWCALQTYRRRPQEFLTVLLIPLLVGANVLALAILVYYLRPS